MDEDTEIVLIDESDGRGYTAAAITEMRRSLERDTGLDLTTMTAKSVVANYKTRGGE